MDCRPAKRAKLLSDDESSGGESGTQPDGQQASRNGSLKVNSEYAKRFEHNKKREEMHRLEEKYKREGDLSDSDSSSEDEDDAGELATVELDGDIEATLKALRSKDPRIYDKKTSFFRPVEETALPVGKKEKPMHLSDYQRAALLNGHNGNADLPEVQPTYSEEQDALRRDLIKQMHAAPAPDAGSEDDDDDDLLKAAPKAVNDESNIHPSRQGIRRELNVKDADRDPEAFLSSFMTSRAWVPDETSRFAPIDSDDSEEEQRAEDFEAAYNMRFEDPEVANAKLMSYGRDTAKYSVRREDKTGRQKQREREKEIVDAAKRERKEEKNRYRNLKLEEMEKKVKQIKDAAGLGKADVLDVNEWQGMLDGDFDDNQWEVEMQRRFGDKYYEARDEDSNSEEESATRKSKRTKVKKPKWNGDIDIMDLVPDFDEQKKEQPQFTLTDDEVDDDKASDIDAAAAVNGAPEQAKSRNQLQAEARSAARRQRAALEDLVDSTMLAEPTTSRSGPTLFRYRETSPTDFGLSARDILFADDSALNTFAGLKKTHAFRDETKKAKDRKKLGKKARLREWRRETFGNEAGFEGTFADFVKKQTRTGEEDDGYRKGVNVDRAAPSTGNKLEASQGKNATAQTNGRRHYPPGIEAPVQKVESKGPSNGGASAMTAVEQKDGNKRKRKRTHKGKKQSEAKVAA